MNRVVLHISSDDKKVYRGLVKQLKNIRKEFPNIQVEVVTHGEAKDGLVSVAFCFVTFVTPIAFVAPYFCIN